MGEASPGEGLTVHLEQCPNCDYSLAGLPPTGRCPECGFQYDDNSLMLMGQPRRGSGMPLHRKLLWAFVILFAWLSFSVVPQVLLLARSRYVLVGTGSVFLLWAVVLTWLLVTGKRERKGMQHVLFTSQGFGIIGDRDPATELKIRMTPWNEVSTLRLDHHGPYWHRVRIGHSPSGRGLGRLRLDMNVKADPEKIAYLEAWLEERIAAGRAGLLS